MAVNACFQDSLAFALEQGGTPLAVRNNDGTITMHEVLLAGIFPGLNSIARLEPLVQQQQQQHTATEIEHPTEKLKDAPYDISTPMPPQHALARADRRTYRLAAKELRNRIQLGEEKYKVQQEIAKRLGMRITDFQACLNCHYRLREKYKLKHRKGWVRFLMKEYPTMTQKEIVARMKTTKEIVRTVQRELRKELGVNNNV